MSQHDVVSIGGIDYDNNSGLPIEKQAAEVHQELRRVQSAQARGLHKTQQRSRTLNRQFVKKATQPVAAQAKRRSAPTGAMGGDIRRVKRSEHISKFARDPQALTVKRSVADIAPQTHPVVAKVHAAHNPVATHAPVVTNVPAAPTSQDIKHAAIGKALANAKTEKAPKKARGRAFSVASASLGVLLIAGYFTYVNMPGMSVRVAAAQAGIDASYPEYRPVGYRLNGPVAYQDGQVSIKFASNSGPLAFALNQSRSSWDSSALLEKYVNPRSDGKYATYNDAGLTIYTYGTDAAWVNGGILYTVEGDASLSNEQIRRIATSM